MQYEVKISVGAEIDAQIYFSDYELAAESPTSCRAMNQLDVFGIEFLSCCRRSESYYA